MADFGDILEEWERRGGGRSAAGGDERAARRKALEEAMLRNAGVRDEGESEEDAFPRTRAQIAALPVGARLDLHGMTAAEAEEALERFFEDAARRGIEKVLVIHGKGIHSEDGPVLGRTVRRFLEASPRAGRHGAADRKDGGNGAVWVLVRGYGQRSR